MWFPLIHTTITHISNFNLRSSRSPQSPLRTVDFTQPGVILDFTTDPINTNQCSGNHPPTKILDKRSNVNPSQMTQFKPATIANLHLWPPIKIDHCSTNDLLIPCQLNRTSDQTWQPKNDSAPRPTSKSQHISLPKSIRIPTPALGYESPCLWASLNIEHNRLTLPNLRASG